MRATGIIVLTAAAALSSAQTYDFEGLAAGMHPSNALPPLTITTGELPHAIVLGGTYTWAPSTADFQISNFGSVAWSGTKVLTSQLRQEYLIDLRGVMSAATILSDRQSFEHPDVIRFIGANQVGTNQYHVVAMDEALDYETTLAGCTLSIAYAPGFTHILLQHIDDAESYDNLTLTPVPEPSSFVALAGLAVLAARRRARR